MIKVSIKPLSVNKAWQGRRFKTKDYKEYEKNVLMLLPNIIVPDSLIKIEIIFAFSNSLSDIDNPLKLFLDIIQKKYGINDCKIYELNVKKVIDKNEYISFKISPL